MPLLLYRLGQTEAGQQLLMPTAPAVGFWALLEGPASQNTRLQFPALPSGPLYEVSTDSAVTLLEPQHHGLGSWEHPQSPKPPKERPPHTRILQQSWGAWGSHPSTS